MKKKAISSLALLLVLAFCLALAGCGETQQQAASPASGQKTDATATGGFTPPDTLEFICCYGAGGGHDTMLRNMESAWRANDLFTGVINYNYQNGGAQAIGMTYTMAQAGRNDCLMSTTAQLVKTPLVTDLGFDWRELTPLILWGETNSFLVIRSGEHTDSLEDFINNSDVITISDSGPGSSGNIIASGLKQYFPDKDIASVTIDGDAEELSNLLGGHTDAMCTELGVVSEYLAETGGTGELKVIACIAGNRSGYLPEVPTLLEMGYDIVNKSFRGVMGPPNMDPAAVEYYVDILLKLTETEEFQKYYTDNNIEMTPMVGDEMVQYLEDFEVWQIQAYKTGGVEMLPKFSS